MVCMMMVEIDWYGDNTMEMRRENPRKEEAKEITARPVLKERN